MADTSVINTQEVCLITQPLPVPAHTSEKENLPEVVVRSVTAPFEIPPKSESSNKVKQSYPPGPEPAPKRAKVRYNLQSLTDQLRFSSSGKVLPFILYRHSTDTQLLGCRSCKSQGGKNCETSSQSRLPQHSVDNNQIVAYWEWGTTSLGHSFQVSERIHPGSANPLSMRRFTRMNHARMVAIGEDIIGF